MRRPRRGTLRRTYLNQTTEDSYTFSLAVEPLPFGLSGAERSRRPPESCPACSSTSQPVRLRSERTAGVFSKSYCPADPAQRNALQQEPFNERALLCCDDTVGWSKNKGPTTEFTAMVLLSRVNVAVPLEPYRSTPRTCLSGYHDALSPRLSSLLLMAQSIMNVSKALLG
jgi:hypothetical protein